MDRAQPNHFWFTPDQRFGFQHFQYPRRYVYPGRVQDEYVVVICLAGAIDVSEETREDRLLCGDVLIGNSRQWRASRYGGGSGDCEGLTLIASRRSVQMLISELGDRRFQNAVVPVFPGTCKMPGLLRVASDVLAELEGDFVGRPQVLELLARELLIRCIRSWPEVRAEQLASTDRVLTRRHYVSALDYMQSHGKADFSIEALSGAIGLSSGEFARLFRRSTGTTPLATYNRLLVDRAIAALENGADSTKEVACSLQFDSVSHFSSLFKKVSGRSPSKARLA